MAETYSSPWDRLTAAALVYADAGDNEEAFAKVKDRLRKAAVSYSRGLLLRPEPNPAPRARKERAAGQLVLWPGADS
jgi:predicted O-linked N-acetylglucosamine transferase (SPINDLY family)